MNLRGAQMFGDFADALARLTECDCPFIVTLADDLTTVEVFHRPGCEVLADRYTGSDTTGGEEGPK